MTESHKNVVFLKTCKVAGSSFVIMSDFPEDKYGRYQIALLVVNCTLFFSTISLNAISIITIRRSSQLRNKVCCFVILLQSVVDISVDGLGIPLTMYYIISPYLDSVNCAFIIFAHRITLSSCGLSMIVLSAVTLERCMGVLHPYYYQTKVTKKRILTYVCGSSTVLRVMVVCTFHGSEIFRFIFTVLMILFLLFSAFSYIRIYLVIRS